MPRAKADFTKNNGFKAFYGFRQGNTLIQPQYTEDSRLFRAKQGGYPNPMPTSVSGLPSLSPVTHRDALYAGFKPLLGRYTMKQVFWFVEPMWNRGTSTQISQYNQGRKVCRLKRLCWITHNLWGHRPAKPGE